MVISRGQTVKSSTPDRIQIDNDLLKLFVQKSSRQEYLDELVNLLRRWSNCRCAGIRMLDPNGNIPYESYTGYSEEFREAENWLSIKEDRCACVRVIARNMESQDPATPWGSFYSADMDKLMNNLSPKQRQHYRGACYRMGFKTVVIIPFPYRDKILGAIHLADERPNVMSQQDVEFIESMTPLIGEALHRFNLEGALHRNYDLEKRKSELLKLALSCKSLQELTDKSLDSLLMAPWVSGRKIEGGGIFLADEKTHTLTMVSATGLDLRIMDACHTLPFGKCLCGRAAVEQRIIHQKTSPADHESLGLKGLASHIHICAPIVSNGKTLGVINIEFAKNHRRGGQDEGFLASIADTLALGIERHQSQRALKQSAAGLTQAQQIAHLGNWDWNITTNELLWSDEIYRIFGLSPREFESSYEAFLERVHPDDRQAVQDEVKSALDGTKPYDIYHRIVKKNGEERIVREKAEITYDDQSQPVRMLGTVQDVTELKRVEAEKETARNELRRRTLHAEAIARVSSRLNRQLDLRSAERTVCEEACIALNVPASSLSIYNEREGLFHHTACVGLPDELCQSFQPLPHAEYERLSDGKGVMLIDDIQKKYPGSANSEIFKELDIHTWLSVQLVREKQLVGSLNVFTFGAPQSFSEDELSLISGLADQAATAISNARVYSEARKRLDRILALRAIDMAIAASMDLRVTLDVLLDQVISQLSIHAADILLLNPGSKMLEFAASRGFFSDAHKQVKLHAGEGLAGQTAIKGQVISIPDINAEPGNPGTASQFTEEGFVSYHAVPLIAKGHVKGVMELFHRSVFEPSPDWIDFLEVLAAQGAMAVDNASLFANLQHSNIELALAYDATLEGWSRALDLRDKETKGHTQRVTNMAVQLAVEIGVSEDDLIHVRRGSLLHDIGKMGIPDNILLKPGTLTPEEWSEMRMHPLYAYQLLSPITYLRQSIDIPYCHHERWDGKGYPRGLKGDRIPLLARIFAIVDVWDALSSDRPYRPAWSRHRIMAHIAANSGSHFDPSVVKSFMSFIAQQEAAA